MAEENSEVSINQLLEFSTPAADQERNFIVVDGKQYFIRSIKEFTLMERHHMAQSAHALQNIAKLGDPTVSDSHIQKAIDGLNSVFKQIVLDGEDLVERLSEDHKGEVLQAFFKQGLQATEEETKETTPMPTSTSSSQPDSNDSMAAVAPTG